MGHSRSTIKLDGSTEASKCTVASIAVVKERRGGSPSSCANARSPNCLRGGDASVDSPRPSVPRALTRKVGCCNSALRGWVVGQSLTGWMAGKLEGCEPGRPTRKGHATSIVTVDCENFRDPSHAKRSTRSNPDLGVRLRGSTSWRGVAV